MHAVPDVSLQVLHLDGCHSASLHLRFCMLTAAAGSNQGSRCDTSITHDVSGCHVAQNIPPPLALEYSAYAGLFQAWLYDACCLVP
jgi:hypothetical protein